MDSNSDGDARGGVDELTTTEQKTGASEGEIDSQKNNGGAQSSVDGDSQEAVCDCCGDDASWEDNPILLCDRCDIAVHTGCYGIKVRHERILE